jgi:signal transduction histidine kinase
MAPVSSFMKRRTLLVALLTVLAPLVLLVGLQYVWLNDLQEVSAVAHKAALNNYLEAVTTEVQYFYRSAAERALNLPASLFLENEVPKAASIWKKKEIEGAHLLFVVDFVQDEFGKFYQYDPNDQSLRTVPASDESMAMIVACVPWQMMSTTGMTTESVAIRVDERNPEYRFLLNPITDVRNRIVGVAGMIVDEEYFRDHLLAWVIERSLPHFFPDEAVEELVVTVRDEENEVVLATGDYGEAKDDAVSRFDFVFTDWSLGLQSRGYSPESWARTQFAVNMTESIILVIVVLGGIVFALRAANRAMKLSEMKSDFVSNVSHELRTPLASIRVFAEFLKLGRAKTPERTQEYGEYIEAESRRLSRLIDNILDFSKIESGMKTYDFSPASLTQVVISTLCTFEVRMRQQGWEVTFEGPESPLPEMALDPDAIAQALNNLLDNAVKYSGDSKSIALRLRLEKGDAVIEVEDRGIGIARAEQSKIYERFHRVGTGLVHDVKGSGLGLSIVQHIVRAHGGEVTVESEPGSGSVFRVRLPLGARDGGAGRSAGGDRGHGVDLPATRTDALQEREWRSDAEGADRRR